MLVKRDAQVTVDVADEALYDAAQRVSAVPEIRFDWRSHTVDGGSRGVEQQKHLQHSTVSS